MASSSRPSRVRFGLALLCLAVALALAIFSDRTGLYTGTLLPLTVGSGVLALGFFIASALARAGVRTGAMDAVLIAGGVYAVRGAVRARRAGRGLPDHPSSP